MPTRFPDDVFQKRQRQRRASYELELMRSQHRAVMRLAMRALTVIAIALAAAVATLLTMGGAQ